MKNFLITVLVFNKKTESDSKVEYIIESTTGVEAFKKLQNRIRKDIFDIKKWSSKPFKEEVNYTNQKDNVMLYAADLGEGNFHYFGVL